MSRQTFKQFIIRSLYVLSLAVLLWAPSTPGVTSAVTIRGLQSLNQDQGLYDPSTQCGTGSVPAANVTTGGNVAATDNETANARIVIGIAKTLGLNQKAALIGLMTALQESTLHMDASDNVPVSKENPAWLALPPPRPIANYDDSVGMFQQRPSMGWSTFGNDQSKEVVFQLMDPAYGSEAFFGVPKDAKLPDGLKQPSALRKGLQSVNGWENMDPNDAAQAVQRSGVPDGYRKRQEHAQSLLDKNWDSANPVPLPIPINGGTPTGSANATSGSNGQCVCSGSGNASSGVIVIDPGHSGSTIKRKDSATQLKDLDYANIPEVDDVWDVSKLVEAQLTAAGYKVALTKSSARDNKFFRERVDVAVANKAALALSIHYDASQPFSNRNNYVYPQVMGRYRTATDGNKILFENEATATQSQAISKIFATERTAAEGHTVSVREDAGPDIGGRSDYHYDNNQIAPGNIWMVQLFSKDIPWIYNEAGGSSAGQNGLNQEDKTKYATGIANAVKKAVPPGNGAAASTGITGTGSTASSSANCNSSASGTTQSKIANYIFKYAWPNYCSAGSSKCNGYASATTRKDEYAKAIESLSYKGDCSGVDCGAFVVAVMRNSTADPDYDKDPEGNTYFQQDYLRRNSGDGHKYRKIEPKNEPLQTGDIAIANNSDRHHTYFYVGKIQGPNGEPFNGDAASASQCGRAPMASSLDDRDAYEWYRLVNPTAPTVPGNKRT